MYFSHQHSDVLNLADGKALSKIVNIKKLVGKALKNIFGGFDGLVEPHLFEITYKAMNDAVDEGFGKIKYGEPNYEFIEKLKKSGAWFAARKSYRQREDLAGIMVDETGKTRTWRQFLSASKSIIQDYNETWLKVEWETAITSASNVKLWKGFEADADLYPNLKYLASSAATPRDEHKKFYGVIRPITDEFWVNHFPPSAFKCQCGVEQTDDDETPVPAKPPKPQPGLDHNPGLTGELFSKSHPYSKDLSDDQLKKIDQAGEDLMDTP